MSEEQAKRLKLLIYWSGGTVVVVFAAITTYIGMIVGGMTGVGEILKAGFPIWSVTALAAVVICAGYYFYIKRKV